MYMNRIHHYWRLENTKDVYGIKYKYKTGRWNEREGGGQRIQIQIQMFNKILTMRENLEEEERKEEEERQEKEREEKKKKRS